VILTAVKVKLPLVTFEENIEMQISGFKNVCDGSIQTPVTHKVFGIFK